MTLPTITQDNISLAAGDELILRFRTWEDYEALLAHREDKAGLRIRYNSKTQEIKIISPLPIAILKQLWITGIKLLKRQIGLIWLKFSDRF
jgi:hypothetical protein